MYSQIRESGLKDFVIRELPALGSAFLIAELFFKFHSFTLECIGFLATWYGLSWIQSLVTGRSKDR